jgi:DNA mismatch repair ATPase MutS
MLWSLILAAALFLVFVSYADRARIRGNTRTVITRRWGKQPQDEYSAEDLKSIAGYFRNSQIKSDSAFAIDDITWRDLDMDATFARLNNTVSTAGEESLYRLLRQPCFDAVILEERKKLIKFFHENPIERFSVQVLLSELGKKRHIGVTDYFVRQQPPGVNKAFTYKLLAMLGVAGPVLLFVTPAVGITLIVISLFINGGVYFSTRHEIASHIDAMIYVVRMVRCIRRLKAARISGLGVLNARLTVLNERLRNIERKGLYLFLASTDLITNLLSDYVNILLLKELIDFEYLRKVASEHREDLLEAYDVLGLIDSMVSIASYRNTIPGYVEPVLSSCASGMTPHLEFENLCHPLVDNCVPNSLRTQQSILVTGSNASGKSTFLKAIAANAIFAQSVVTCVATLYRSSFFIVLSSMALRDNVVDDESYFIAEIKSLKRILDCLNEDKPCLCLIDEVLRGTNTVERIAASSQLLHHISQQNCLCLAATHDIELTHMLEPFYRNVHFKETVTEDRVMFDYRLCEGRSTTRNAIRLLQVLGYPEEIVKSAEDSATRFMAQGKWE